MFKTEIIGVFCGGNPAPNYYPKQALIDAILVGGFLAGCRDSQSWNPVHLLTGGGQGLMLGVCEGFVKQAGIRGFAIGVIPDGKKSNIHIEIPILTHLQDRNPINARTVKFAIVLYGEEGTANEGNLMLGLGKTDSL